MAEEARLSQQAELARLRLVVDHRATLDGDQDRACGGRSRVTQPISIYHLMKKTRTWDS